MSLRYEVQRDGYPDSEYAYYYVIDRETWDVMWEGTDNWAATQEAARLNGGPARTCPECGPLTDAEVAHPDIDEIVQLDLTPADLKREICAHCGAELEEQQS